MKLRRRSAFHHLAAVPAEPVGPSAAAAAGAVSAVAATLLGLAVFQRRDWPAPSGPGPAAKPPSNWATLRQLVTAARRDLLDQPDVQQADNSAALLREQREARAWDRLRPQLDKGARSAASSRSSRADRDTAGLWALRAELPAWAAAQREYPVGLVPEMLGRLTDATAANSYDPSAGGPRAGPYPSRRSGAGDGTGAPPRAGVGPV